MSDKTPLIGGNAPTPPSYQTEYGAQPPQPPQPAPNYDDGAGVQQQQQFNAAPAAIVIQARPVENRVFVEYKPSSYVGLSVFTMLCFCWICGLIGLIMALQVDSAWHNGDHDEARRLSNSARIWNIVGIISGVIMYVVLVVVVPVVVTTFSDSEFKQH